MPKKEERQEIEVKIEHTTEKAWLVIETTSEIQVWAPKSQCEIVSGPDEDGNTILRCSEWWLKKANLL